MLPTPRQCADAIRALSMDAVQQANSGHPGAPMGMADMAYALWQKHLRHHPKNPHWLNRDRFILSNGHASMLLYALLHLTGYDLPLSELQNFRQLNSKTPGHPEYGVTPGVETTTGPLGQGIANAVGMALAEHKLAQHYNRPGHTIVEHHTYVFLGDGCLMEGISHEVCSLAGTLKLGKLIALWDDNHISIDGNVAGWFTDDTCKRFESYGWQVIGPIDGQDWEAVDRALVQAKENTQQPTLIACRTTIGCGAPNLKGTAKTHGSPLGALEIEATRACLEWPHQPFEVPEAIYRAWDACPRGAKLEQEWQLSWDRYRAAYPDLADEFLARMQAPWSEAASDQVQAQVLHWQSQAKAMATRKASQAALEVIGPLCPALIGGSADLTESNLTHWSGSGSHNYIHFGVREFGMNAILNGLALHGGFIPYGGTFLTFYDYGKNAVRLSALMKQRVIYVYTHDSIGLGEDGPTHQPIEHLANLRTIPYLECWRPADAVETLVSWQAAMGHQGPTALCLTRQTVPALSRTEAQLADISKGAYRLTHSEQADLLLIATGSEVALALEVANLLEAEGWAQVVVVSMPCMERFLNQSQAYQAAVIDPTIRRRVAIEAAHSQSWYRWVGLEGLVVGLDRFGESAPAEALWTHFGFEARQVVEKIRGHYDNTGRD